jgi:predicted small lipoprotein YifL
MKKLILALCMVVMVFALVGCGQKEKTPELTDAEKFAEENSISVELAQDIENALSQTDVPPSLNKLNEWEQIEDYADGQRYTGWVYSTAQDKYYYMVFYVSGDTVEGIRDQKNGLEYLYQNEN